MISAGGSGPSPQLPYDAQVEYLQGDGNTYIYSAFFVSGNLQIKARLVDYFTSAYLGKWPFGGRNGYMNKCFGMYTNSSDNKVHFCYGSVADNVYNTYSSYPSTCDVEIGNGIVKIGNTTHSYTISSFSGGTYTLMLFALNNAGTAIPSNVKIGPVYITDGVKTQDLIPVRKNGVGYMYDKISGELLINAGSGAFIIGPDV